MTDPELDHNRQPLVLEYGTWTGERFVGNSGTIVRSTAGGNTALVRGLDYPNSIKRSGLNTYYVAQIFDGTIRKVIL